MKYAHSPLKCELHTRLSILNSESAVLLVWLPCTHSMHMQFTYVDRVGRRNCDCPHHRTQSHTACLQSARKSIVRFAAILVCAASLLCAWATSTGRTRTVWPCPVTKDKARFSANTQRKCRYSAPQARRNEFYFVQFAARTTTNLALPHSARINLVCTRS